MPAAAFAPPTPVPRRAAPRATLAPRPRTALARRPAMAMNPAMARASARALSGLALNLPLYALARAPAAPRVLTPAGLRHALFLALALFFLHGAGAYALCASFLVLGSAATRVGAARKEDAGIAEARGGARGPRNLWGSAGAALACLAAGFVVGGGVVGAVARVAYVAAIATKMSDTLASEIGKAYGGDTWLITSGRKVPRGTEGGVSVEGSVAGVAGSLVAAAIGALTGLFWGVDWPVAAAIVAVSALVGTTVESVIGERLQERLQWSNELVNFVNTAVGASTAALLTFALR
jgi:uncharacterized protein (TIGR00297 family)